MKTKYRKEKGKGFLQSGSGFGSLHMVCPREPCQTYIPLLP